MDEDIVRVLRIIEYVGPRSKVEKQIGDSLHGTKDHGNGVRISAVTLGEYPEIMERANHETVEERAKRFAASPLGQAMKAEKAAEAIEKAAADEIDLSGRLHD
jgi:hypothetical protein